MINEEEENVMTWYFDGYDDVAYIDVAESYEYDVIKVVKNDEGYFIATDSGCSCYSPFESYLPSDMTGPLTREQAKEEFESLVTISYYGKSDWVKAELAEELKNFD